MKKADLFNTKASVKDNEVVITLVFSKLTKWTPKVILKENITLKEFLKCLNYILAYRANDKVKSIENPLNVEFKKTTASLIFKETYFTLKLKDMYRIAEYEAEKLFTKDIITI